MTTVFCFTPLTSVLPPCAFIDLDFAKRMALNALRGGFSNRTFSCDPQ